MSSIRFWTVVALLAGSVGLLRARGDVDRVPVSQPLDQMPRTMTSVATPETGVGGAATTTWTSTDVPMDPEVLAVLGKGVFLDRIYTPVDKAGQKVAAPPVALFIGYFPTQRTGQSIHSPQNCLPGSGWVFESSGVTDIKDTAGKNYQVGEYLIANSGTKAEVLYWYQSHGRSVASDYRAKLYMISDSIRYNRTDAALVRIVTSVRPGESREEAHARAAGFASGLLGLLPAYIPN